MENERVDSDEEPVDVEDLPNISFLPTVGQGA